MNGFSGEEFNDILADAAASRPMQLRSVGYVCAAIAISLGLLTGNVLWTVCSGHPWCKRGWVADCSPSTEPVEAAW